MGDVKRRYDASRRREQAAENRARILAAARESFEVRGYGGTTIAEIARTAGVAAETVYATFRNKPTLLYRAWDIAVGGDEQDVHLLERPELQAVFAEPDLPTRLRLFAAVNTVVMRRTAGLRLAVETAAESEPAVAVFLEGIDAARFAAMGVHALRAKETGQLAVSEEECRDVLFAMTDGTLWRTLVVRQGWSDDRYATWLGTLWATTLAAP
ncbi:TetR/AcrR family transcriptional regulator [Kutzneria chonburiensis]|uniref:TetR/AcrR family transcriptional regulator n=1 Tax=Kutzneria chonburiensis TaxID=1483604 RepID=A0ABV6MPH6_9PSEU|nr:helix-turn-helix domain containing protein [Kutzneria chonburiensis]